jgi:hypothetical protein
VKHSRVLGLGNGSPRPARCGRNRKRQGLTSFPESRLPELCDRFQHAKCSNAANQSDSRCLLATASFSSRKPRNLSAITMFGSPFGAEKESVWSSSTSGDQRGPVRLLEPGHHQVYDRPLRAVVRLSGLLLPSPWIETVELAKLELLSLKWQQIDFTHGRIRILNAKTNSSERSIPLNSTAHALLCELARKKKSSLVFSSNRKVGKRFRDLKKGFKKAVQLAGLPKIRFHDLRHTFATRLVQSGVDIITVQHLLGHAKISMTARYAHSPNNARIC